MIYPKQLFLLLLLQLIVTNLSIVHAQELVTHQTACPVNMQLVDGMFCPNVRQTCAQWSRNDPAGQQMRCLRFSESTCLSRHRVHMRFCMDTYEYPNIEGQRPRNMISWYQARSLCQSQGKRLCDSTEWTFACEGPEVRPYPYGNGMVRDSSVCRIDHQNIRYNAHRLANPLTALQEARRSNESVPSGSMNQCVSWCGIYDIVGNSDEWVVNVHSANMDHAPYRSGLRGGWWGGVRNRCRAMTTVHSPSFSYYQISTRCCSDAR